MRHRPAPLTEPEVEGRALWRRRRSSIDSQSQPVPRIVSGAAPVAVGTGLLLIYLPVFGHAVEVWRSDQEFSFGFLVPPIALFLLWHGRAALRASVSTRSRLGLIPMVGGLALLVAGAHTGIHALSGASFLPTVTGATAFLYGIPVSRAVLLPAALQTVSLSLYRGLLDQLGFTLQEWTARGAMVLGRLSGLPVRGSGVDLFVGRDHFVVAQSCSGMDALLALLCLGILCVGLARASFPRRLALLALVLPIILSANVIRVALVLVLSRWLGTVVTTGAGHQALDGVLFICAALLFYAAGLILRCAPRFDATLSSSR